MQLPSYIRSRFTFLVIAVAIGNSLPYAQSQAFFVESEESTLDIAPLGFSAEPSQPRNAPSGIFSVSAFEPSSPGSTLSLSLNTLSAIKDLPEFDPLVEALPHIQTVEKPIIPLTFPNPFRFNTGAQIGYTLPRDMAIELKLFSMTGRSLASHTFSPGFEGGKSGYNRIPITTSLFDGTTPSAGVYFYLLLCQGKVIARERMVIIP